MWVRFVGGKGVDAAARGGWTQRACREALVSLNHLWLEELRSVGLWAGVFVYLESGLQCLIWRREAAIIVILP